MITECREINVQAADFAHCGGGAFHASLPGGCQNGNRCGASRAADQKRLAAALWIHVETTGKRRWLHRRLLDKVAPLLQVDRSPLGKPQLWLGAVRGPAVSFSEGGGKLWAALCGDGSDVGIDVATDDEFQGEYPMRRVFHDQELRHAGLLIGGGAARAAALLWSVKEAVVKALGCGFHLVDPRQMHVSPSIGGDGEYMFPVGLSGKALTRYPLGGRRSIWVRSYSFDGMWLSVALAHRQLQEDDVRISRPTLYRSRRLIHDQKS